MTERGKQGVVTHAVGMDDFIADKNRLLKRYTFFLSENMRINPIRIDIFCVFDDAFAGKPRSYRFEDDPNL
ncbi:hypothetical protein AEQ67_24515 [Pseudomonas sp. RIT-PI-q]|nr:hypothetical protein AEQ67_24515 [Pseudomonas sp. RIT-PI-q]